MKGFPVSLLFLFVFLFGRTSEADVVATFNSASDVPVVAATYTASGQTFTANLNFAPATGTTLTVVKNTGLAFISGTFSNLAQGQVITLPHGGINYQFVANYFGGSGNDLVLHWWPVKLVAWGDNSDGQLGIGPGPARGEANPVAVPASGVLVGKTVISVAAGYDHTLAICSDGTVAAWGDNTSGQLGNNTTTDSNSPVLVDRSGALLGKTVVAVAAGYAHSIALCSDGTLAAWGLNSAGQLGNGSTLKSPVPVLVDAAGVLAQRSVVAIAAGFYHSLAVCSDGAVVTWGDNTFGQLGNDRTDDSSVPVLVDHSGVLAGKSVTAVSAGYYHSLALCSDGTIFAWGSNDDSELANFPGDSSSVPVAVNTGVIAGRSVSAISAGSHHNLALCSDGTIAAWGLNNRRQLGDGSDSDWRSAPVAVDSSGVLSGKVVSSIAAGNLHSLALCSDGSVATWGENFNYQLGNGGTDDSAVPVLVNKDSFGPGARFAAARCSGAASHNFGWIARPILPIVARLPFSNLSKTTVTLNGTVNPDGSPATAYFEYGLTTSYGTTAPVGLDPADGTTAVPVSATLSGLTSGATYHYRLTSANALGASSTADGTFSTPVDVTAAYTSSSDVPFSGPGFTAMGATFASTLSFAPAVGTNLLVVNNTGFDPILGTFTNLSQGQIVTMTYESVNYRFVANYFGGTGNDLVLEWANVHPVAWGMGTSGQLGEAKSASRTTPVSVVTTGVLSGKILRSIASGGSHSLAVASDGTVAAWGSNDSGQLGMTGGNRSSPIAVTSGVLPGKTVKSVSAGTNHSVALCSDGSLAAWGSNGSGQLGNRSTFSSTAAVQVDGSSGLAGKKVARVAAGGLDNLALCEDGTLVAWGSNAVGQLGINTGSQSILAPIAVPATGALVGKTIISIAAGDGHSLALCSDGTIAAWGGNGHGQLGLSGPGYTSQPVPVNANGVLAGKVVTAIAAGARFSVALCADGTIAAWGENTNGQLGNGSNSSSSAPVKVVSNGVLAGKTIVSISAGASHCLARCSDGTTAAWGLGSSGQLGSGNSTSQTTPVLVKSAGLVPGEVLWSATSGFSSAHNLALIAVPPSPGLSNIATANLTETSATLMGSVNPAGSSVAVSFEYGTTTSYGTMVDVTTNPISGTSPVSVSVNLAGLVQNTTYHFRVRATNGGSNGFTGGSTISPDFTFTTLADTSGPSGGTITLSPLSPLEPGESVTAGIANWQDSSLPLYYVLFVDDTMISPPLGGSESWVFTAPIAAGVHTLRAQIYDRAGNYTEEVRSMTVASSREDWRKFWFGTVTNEGSASDSADPDGDGHTNDFEYVSRSSPTDSRSSFNVKVSAVPAQPSHMAITFGPIAAGRSYVVKYTSSLATPIWTPVTDFTVTNNGNERTITDQSAQNAPRFYRVEIQYP